MSTIKKYAIIVGVLICTHAAAYAFGRYGVPEKVVERETVKVVEVEKQVVVVQEKVKIEKVFVADTKKRIHREERKVEHPSGLTETFKTEDINVDRVVTETSVQFVDRMLEKETIKWQDRILEKEKIVEAPKPNWRVGGLVGYDLGHGLSLEPTNVLYGGVVERRIFGPVSAGAWGVSSGQFGVLLTLEL
jgi:hypothetical protein